MELINRVHAVWPSYLGAHLHPRNRTLHFIGTSFTVGFLLSAAIFQSWILLAASLLGYLPAWVGHFVLEGNRPRSFEAPVTSALCDLKLCVLRLNGELDREIERLFGTVTPPIGAKPLTTEQEEAEYQDELRLRVGPSVPDHPFEDYWDIFLLKHRHPVNVWGHVLAMFWLYGVVLLAIVKMSPSYLLLAPLSQASGLIFHSLFERSHIDLEDAVASRRALPCLNKMVFLICTGQYWKEVARVEGELAQYLSGAKNSPK